MRQAREKESGVALIVVLMSMVIFTLMSLGFYYMVTAEQKIAASDRDNTVAFYGAEGGLEKMSSDLAGFFVSHTSPTPAQIDVLTGSSYRPTISGVTFGTGGYTIAYSTNTDGTLKSTAGVIGGSGPLAGLQGIITPFTLAVIATGPNNTEVKLTRQVQEVAVPVFQYGIFSENDLSFFAGPPFNFGGRVHTNQDVYVAEVDTGNCPPSGSGGLVLNDKVSAFGNVIRTQLSNGLATASNYAGRICPITTPGSYRALAMNEGSLLGGPGSSANPNWRTISLTTYNGNIRTGSTGAKKLNLALAFAGATPIEIIRRPPVGEDPLSTVGSARFFNQASLRIVLSDNAATLTGLPGATSTAPYPLDEALVQRTVPTGALYLSATGACNPPMAKSPGWSADNDYMSPINTTLLGGYIKIEIQLNSSPGTWQDVTKEILSLGISSDVQSAGTSPCTNNKSILRLEKAKPVRMAVPTLTTASGGSLSVTTYYYVVTALGAWGETLGTEAPKATTSSKKTITVSWTAYPSATGYRIYRGTSAGGETGYIPLTVGTAVTGWASPWTSYTDSGATLTSGSPPTTILNSLAATQTATNFAPINMYDPREGEVRDGSPSPPVASPTIALGGVMNIVEINVQNLQKWFANTLDTVNAPSGALALNQSGYIVYFSDRRGNQNASGNETGEYGFEDIINPNDSAGLPNTTLDDATNKAEDVNDNGTLELYGKTPHPLAVDSSGTTKFPISSSSTTLQTFVPAAAPAGSISVSRITGQTGTTWGQAQKNSVVFFRRALRLVNGSLGNLPPRAHANCSSLTAGGFTVAAENPVYIWGNYNADQTNGYNDNTASGLCHVPAAVIGDAVTLLSSNWTDAMSFTYPDTFCGTTTCSCSTTSLGVDRGARTTNYRTAIISGKNKSFPRASWVPAANRDFGTDGGAHNFLRYVEDWGGQTLNYRGSIVSFYIARQAVGVYKCCDKVYSPPDRGYNFDTDFQDIAKLPPGTPRFTDVNALAFRHATLPNQ
jgi:hypothetical protein